MTVPDWLTQRGGNLKLGSDGRTWYVLIGLQPQYSIVAVPVARLTPVPPTAARHLGWDQGDVPDSALRPMTDEEAEAFLSGR